MGVIEERYIPSRQQTESAELDAWIGAAPMPRLQIAPPDGEKADISMTMTPKGAAKPEEATGTPGEASGSFEAGKLGDVQSVLGSIWESLKSLQVTEPSATLEEAIKASGIDPKYIPKDLGLIEVMMGAAHATTPTGPIKVPATGTPEAAATREAAFKSPGRFNPEHQLAPEEITDLTAALNVRAREAGMMQEQTRGKQTWLETDKKANELIKSGKMSVERIVDMKPGEILNAEEATAARGIRDTVALYFKQLLDQADAGDEAAKAGLEKAGILASRIETNVEAATGTEVARALASRRRASFGYDIDDIYQRMAQRSIDPNVLHGFYRHLTSNTEKEAFTKYLETTSRTGRWVNAFLEARAAGLLTIRSIERNLVGSGASTIWSVSERLATAVTGTVRGTQEGAYAHEAVSMLHGIYNAQANALSMAAKALKTGESQFIPGSNQAEQFMPKISSEALNLGKMASLPGIGADKLWQASPIGHFVDVMGELIRWPFRGLVAGDDYFKYVNYEGQKYALAYREYQRLLKSGASQADAAKEYSTLIRQPPEWLDQAAAEHSLYATFNDEILNRYGKAVMAIRDGDDPGAQIARFVLPFARTPMNVMGYGAERTPGLNFLSSHFWQEIKAGGVRKDAAYGRLALGAGVLGAFAVLAGNSQITGKGPADPKLRALYIQNGWKPYSVILPAVGPISYLGFSPLSEILGMAADFSELVTQGADDVALGQMATAMVLSIANVIEEYPMLKGVADIVDAMRNTTRRSEGVIQEAFKSMMPVPGAQGIARTISGITDPLQRETRSPQGGAAFTGLPGLLEREVNALWEELAAATPWLQNYQHPKRDILGRPMIRQGGWWTVAPTAPSAQEPHPVLDELVKHQIAVGLPAKAFGPGKQTIGAMDDESMDTQAVILSPKEWARYQDLAGTIKLASGFPSPSGRTLEEELRRVIASREYQREADGPAGGKAALLKDAFREYREEAKAALLKELRIDGKPGTLETLVEEKQRIEEFKGMTKDEQARARPGLERDLGKPINIGILR